VPAEALQRSSSWLKKTRSLYYKLRRNTGQLLPFRLKIYVHVTISPLEGKTNHKDSLEGNKKVFKKPCSNIWELGA
jgi:hypothetical protein